MRSGVATDDPPNFRTRVRGTVTRRGADRGPIAVSGRTEIAGFKRVGSTSLLGNANGSSEAEARNSPPQSVDAGLLTRCDRGSCAGVRAIGSRLAAESLALECLSSAEFIISRPFGPFIRSIVPGRHGTTLAYIEIVMTMSSLARELLATIQSRQARVGVVGLGYVGLPLAVEFARSGFAVTGIDLDPRKTGAISNGHSYIPDVSGDDVAAFVKAGRLTATADFGVVANLDTINICVPTPLRKTKDPDMSYIVSAVEAIAERLHPGMLIVLESTTYPGTTEELVQPLLERGGLRAGRDFFVAFSPERVDPGNPHYNTRNVPKVIGGLTPVCSELAHALYAPAIEHVVPVSSPRVAEMVKLLENTFRAVNIGLVNEIALMCDKLGIDVWEVVDAAKTKPFGFMPFYPGP